MAVGEQFPYRSFEIRERDESGGRLRLILLGHLDDRAAQELGVRLQGACRRRRSVCLDLSQLARFEPGAAEAILSAVGDVHRTGCNLEISFV